MPTKRPKKSTKDKKPTRNTELESGEDGTTSQSDPDYLEIARIAATLLPNSSSESEAVRTAYRLIDLAKEEHLQARLPRQQTRDDFDKKDRDFRDGLPSNLSRDEDGKPYKDAEGNRPPLLLGNVLVNIFPHDPPKYRESKLKAWFDETEGSQKTYAIWEKQGVPAQAYEALRLTLSKVLRRLKEKQTRDAGKKGGKKSGEVRRGEAPKKKVKNTRLTATQKRGLRGIEKNYGV